MDQHSYTSPGSQRFSARRKVEIVLHLLRGEDLELLSRKLGVTLARLSQWQEQFLKAGRVTLKKRPQYAQDRLANYKELLAVVFFCFFIVCNSGCGTMSNGRQWGQDATLFPGWEKVGNAALDAVVSPATWLPAAGALVLQIDNWDHRVSAYASRQTPIFGSQSNALNYSDYFLAASEATYALTVLTTPSGDQPADWMAAKFKGLAVGMAAYGITEGSTYGLQLASHRQRPNQSDSLSLPSSHSSSTSVYSTLAASNLNYICIPKPVCLAGKIGCTLMPVGTAWARIEGKMHYPSDVLLGMALGHFLGTFMNNAFMNINDKSLELAMESSRNNLLLSLRIAF